MAPMVMHDYLCGGCNSIFEEFAAFDERILKCGVCGADANRVYLKL